MTRAIPLFRVELPSTTEQMVMSALRSGRIASGPCVAAFEKAVGEWVGANALAVNGASQALTLALFLAGVRPGSEVVISPLACMATTSPIANLFAHPVWCDVNPDTGMPDPEHIDAALGERVRAVILYHWGGDVGFVEEIASLCARRGVALIEDATEAFGAEICGLRLGRHGADYTVYSFGAVRHITAIDGAALVVRDGENLKRATRLRRFGIDDATFRAPGGDLNPASPIPEAGFGYALNEIAAAVGLAGFSRAEEIVAAYRRNGALYERTLGNIPGLRQLHRRNDAVSGYWTYTLRAERRDDLLQRLHASSIGAQRLHLRNDRYSCFVASPSRRPLPGVDMFERDNLAIPCGPWVSEVDAERVVDTMRKGW